MPIRIRSKRAGFRRCGIAHAAEWVEYADDVFTPEQLRKLIEEPMLQVAVFEADIPSSAAEAVGPVLKDERPGPHPEKKAGRK